ncbi:recombinase family protein [Sorangium sp. So ce1000]|uniref:recombinase family protein n=1 Tax=Sorangium sp. So ce1000 TaxID=3133325 RepID=UPI003F5EFE41
MTAPRFKRGSPDRAVAYVRVSTDAACASAPEQRAAIEAWARREGVEIAAWHEDRGEDISDRPGLVAALEGLTLAGAGVLAVASEDRASIAGMSGPYRSAAGERGARLVTADGSGMPDGTHRCPICGDPLDLWPRHPRAVCGLCKHEATDEAGRPLEFFNTSFDGGFGARYAGTGEPRDSHACVIRGVRCRADEARFGGIVIEAIDEKP